MDSELPHLENLYGTPAFDSGCRMLASVELSDGSIFPESYIGDWEGLSLAGRFVLAIEGVKFYIAVEDFGWHREDTDSDYEDAEESTTEPYGFNLLLTSIVNVDTASMVVSEYDEQPYEDDYWQGIANAVSKLQKEAVPYPLGDWQEVIRFLKEEVEVFNA